MPLNIRIQWNAGTACVSECVLKTLACWGLRVGPSMVRSVFGYFLGGFRAVKGCLKALLGTLFGHSWPGGEKHSLEHSLRCFQPGSCKGLARP